uniref:Uncharacterized protein n=1 Tax=Tetranychus urticae TaxID=32264 RepID=T1L1P4_TETUR
MVQVKLVFLIPTIKYISSYFTGLINERWFLLLDYYGDSEKICINLMDLLFYCLHYKCIYG